MIFLHFNQNLTEVGAQALIDKKSALVEEMARHWTCKKALTEPVMTQFTEEYNEYTHYQALTC